MAMIIMNNITADLTEEEIAELEAAEKMPISYDEDCPKMTETQLRQFKRGRRVSIPVSESDMNKIRELGADYIDVLQQFLHSALNNGMIVQNR